MNNNAFDCAIIGGGLAGLTLAIQLADMGRAVVLFEKEKYPFNKVCGEYISMESHAFLQRLGIDLSGVPYITQVKVSAPNGNSILKKLDMGGFGISRYTLDWQLAQLAVKKGVVLLENTKVNDVVRETDSFMIKTTIQDYTARLVCGAFGKRSSIEKSLGRTKPANSKRKNYVAVKYHVKTDLPANRIELHNFENGYCGISKVDGDKYCLCYLTDSENLSKSGNSIKAMEQNIVMKNPFLKKYFTVSEFLYHEPLTISQVSFSKKSAIENGVIMLGDAAGTIAPLCGNGMSMAMHASFIAASLINDFLNNTISREQLYTLYEKQWNNLFSKRIRTGASLQHLFGKNHLTNVSISLLKALPPLADKLISMTHGKVF
ncbi:MAG TPA: NAD(P)/FAD-dependent oxidoreductase [Bacteroidia bacterium]|nr:NAD(P)/FAD-dependent oxidoreductase [Bacteroidia bacterium]